MTISGGSPAATFDTSKARSADGSPATGPGVWGTTVVASLAILASYAPQLATTVALPSIQRGLSASASSLQWVSDLCVIPMAALILSAGVFGDVHGRRKVMLVGLGLNTIGAALALRAPNIQVLWVAEAVMGAAAAGVMPSSLATISHAVRDVHQRARHIAIWATSLIVGMGIGGITAGAALKWGSWRWAFLPCLILAVLALGIAALRAPDSRAPVARHLDWTGQFLGALAVCALIFGVIEGAGSSGWADWRSIGGFAVAAAAFALFVPAELASSSPMFDLRVFRYRAFTGASLVATIAMFGMIGLLFVLALFFGNVQHLDGLQIAVRFAIFCATQIVIGPLAGRLMHRVRAHLLMAVGLVLIAAVMLSLVTTDPGAGLGAEALRLVLIGIGFGLVFAPMTAAAVSAVEHHHIGMASAGINTIRQLGGALGPAVLGAILTARTAAYPATHGHGATQAADSLTYGMHVCAVVAAIAMLVAALAVLTLRPHHQG
jgi:EmrB/QacA subfamily drug resistance transporter